MRSGISLPYLLIPVVDTTTNPGLTSGGRDFKALRMVEMASWQRVGSSCSGKEYHLFWTG